MKDFVSVIDIGSSKITSCVAKKGVNGTFIIKNRKSFSYEGFLSSKFLDEENFKSTLIKAVEFVVSENPKYTNKIFIGVPGAFFKTEVLSSSLAFTKKTKITINELDSLYDGAFQISSTKNTLIDRSAIYYELDDGTTVRNPLNKQVNKINAKLSFDLLDNYFISIVSDTLKLNGIDGFSFVCSPLAMGRYLLDKNDKNEVSLVLDIGYISSTLFAFNGDGLLFTKSFDNGGGYITGAISEKLGVEFDVAESLKRKLNLASISYKGCYNIIEADNGNYFSQDEVKSVVLYVLDQLCENIYDTLNSVSGVIPDFGKLYITGGGISYLRGAKERISERLERNVELLTCSVPLCEEPQDSSLYSLLNYAFDKLDF